MHLFDWFHRKADNHTHSRPSRPSGPPRPETSPEELRHLVHTEMTHKAIPSVAFADPALFLECLRGTDAPQRLQHLWKGICDLFDPDGLVGLPGVEQFAVFPFHEGNFLGVILGFPEPRRASEAHFAAFYAQTHEIRSPEERASRPEEVESWYLTLERADELCAAETQLGGWTPEGLHVTHGPGPRPDLASFLQAVEARVRSGSGDQPASTVASSGSVA